MPPGRGRAAPRASAQVRARAPRRPKAQRKRSRKHLHARIRKFLLFLFGTKRLTAKQLKHCKQVAKAFAALPKSTLVRLVAVMVRASRKRGGCAPSRGPSRHPSGAPLLDPSTVRAYAPGPYRSYGKRQDEEYAKPTGWMRMNVANIPANAPCFRWSVGYHGTAPQNIKSILTDGLVAPAARGTNSSHGQAHATPEARGRTIYTSPCIGYSAHPVYTPLEKNNDEELTFSQVVLQVRVDQSRVYKRVGSTLGEKYWPADLPFAHGFANDGVMEWLTTDPDGVHVTGIMIREVGNGDKAAWFGDAACEFEYDDNSELGVSAR